MRNFSIPLQEFINAQFSPSNVHKGGRKKQVYYNTRLELMSHRQFNVCCLYVECATSW